MTLERKWISFTARITLLTHPRAHAQAYAAFPCLDCFVTDAGCYYEYKQDR